MSIANYTTFLVEHQFITNFRLKFSESIQALPDHVLMMQIDCEVINTGLVHIREDAIPLHLNARMRPDHGAGESITEPLSV